MDIYSIGEEKCIDGVWGRMVGKRFYTDTLNTSGTVYLSRRVDVDSVLTMYSVLTKCDFPQGLYEIITDKGNLNPYKPKPIEHKRGDIVWVKSSARFTGEVWSPVVYLSRNSFGEFICNEVFDELGGGLGFTARNYKEVFLKPPFDF